MSSKKLIFLLLIAIMGVANIFVGAWSFITLNSLNITTKISNLSTQLEAFDVSLVKTTALQESLSNLKQSTLEDLNLIGDFSEMLTSIPLCFIITGTLFLTITLLAYFIIPDTKKPKEN